MVRKRNMTETAIEEEAIIINPQITPEITISDNENSEYQDFLTAARELRNSKEIEGYILKGEAQATVDLNDSTKIIEYAMLTSQAFESASALSSAFNVGDIENILIEGKNMKALCIRKDQNNLGIFMKKNVDDADILAIFQTMQ